MKKFDVIVIGSGSGGEIVDAALNHGFYVAWVDKRPLGGQLDFIGRGMHIHPARPELILRTFGNLKK